LGKKNFPSGGNGVRVLLINPRFRGGGAERCVRELFERLPASGVDAELWVKQRQSGDPHGVREMRRPWEYVFDGLELVSFWSDWRHRGAIRLLDAISPGDFDAVHLHVVHSGCASIHALRRLCERVPVVWTMHDEWASSAGNACDLSEKISREEVRRMTAGWRRWLRYDVYHDNPRWRLLRRFLDRWMPQPSLIVTPSHFLEEKVVASGRFPGVRIEQCYHGVSMLDEPQASASRDWARSEFGLSDRMPVVLLIAANVAEVHKGMEFALQALDAVRLNHSPQILLLGRNSERLARRVSGYRVVCGEASTNERLALAYRAADVTLVPSLAESLSFVALESLACQTPVCAFAVGGLREIIGANERGRLAEPFSSRHLAENLGMLLGDAALRRELGMRGSTWVRENCDMGRYLERVVAHYRLASKLFASSR
jgi:glycosyltransferase involved in cell wall biosynthesis